MTPTANPFRDAPDCGDCGRAMTHITRDLARCPCGLVYRRRRDGLWVRLAGVFSGSRLGRPKRRKALR